jgi:hypothetical protein
MMRSRALAFSFVTVSLLAVTAAHAQRSAPSSFDSFGYQAVDSSGAQCSYSYVDASGGDILNLTAASNAANAPTANDDGGAVVSLSAPFQLYGVSQNSLVASSNGYLAAATDLTQEDGGDFSQDCPLPAIADNVVATQARIYAYHADLDGTPNNGTMYTQFYASCPRASDSGNAEACTVVQWQNWAMRGQTGTLNMEAVLYHTTFEIALQYQTLDASLGSTATIGTQSNNATSGNAYACGGASHNTDRIFANGFDVVSRVPAMAVCFFDPRYLPAQKPGGH